MHQRAQRFCQTNPRLGVWREGASKGLGVYLQKEGDRVRLRTCSNEERNQRHVAKSQPVMGGATQEMGDSHPENNDLSL